MGQVRRTPPKVPPGMKAVEGKYHYLIYDLEEEQAQEVLLRMQAMVEEYMVRTRDFSGRLNQKLPFMIFRHREDYYKNGGMPGTAGVFMGGEGLLMAIAGEELTPATWHVIQHEGFHQFADAVIGEDLPAWVNEGLAEYFGEAVYTGDGFVSGAMPRFRVKRVQEELENRRFKSAQSMMELSLEKWNAEMRIENYDQAWSMVQFLAHGEDGKYQKAFGKFMISLNKRTPWAKAWSDSFGSAQGFDDKYTAWWKAQNEDSSTEVYAKAEAQLLTSYLARGISQKQTFTSLEELTKAIEAGEVKWHKEDVLPKGLAKDAVSLMKAVQKAGGTFTFNPATAGAPGKPAQQPSITCELKDGTKFTSSFKLKGQHVASVELKIDTPKPATGVHAAPKKD
jgi:hypothetical protein